MLAYSPAESDGPPGGIVDDCVVEEILRGARMYSVFMKSPPAGCGLHCGRAPRSATWQLAQFA